MAPKTIAELAKARLDRHKAETVALATALASDPATMAEVVHTLGGLHAAELRGLAAAAGILSATKQS